VNLGAAAARRLRGVAVDHGLVASEAGVAGTVRSLREWVAEHEDHCGARWISTPLPDERPLQPPRTVCPEGTAVFEAALEPWQTLSAMRADAADVAVLPGGRLVTEDGLVVTHDDLLATESAWDDEKIEASGVLRMRRLPRARVAPGAHASLLSQWCREYYHWITDALPRLSILDAAGCSDVQLVVPDGLTAWQRRSLELLGVRSSRLTPHRGGCLRPDTLIWPRPAAITGHVPRWACDWLRDRFVGSAAQPQRRLYLTRRGEKQRRVSNEDEVWSLLRSRDFEMVDAGTLSLDAQIALFADAAVVVAPHGGALTNIVFAREAKVIELFEPGYLNPCYYALAERSGHEYWHIIGEAQSRGDFRVEVSQLAETLAAAGV